MIYEIRIKTENLEDYLAVKDMVSEFMDGHLDNPTKNVATEGSGDPYWFNAKMINTYRPLKHHASQSPNRNITDKELDARRVSNEN